MDGATVARQILQQTAEGAAEVQRRSGRAPALATVLIGSDPASHTYVKMKVNRSRAAGIRSVGHDLPDTTTTAAAVALVTAYQVPVEGSHAVVIGRSAILGKPVAMLLVGRNATVTICHSRIRNLPQIVGTGDIVLAAVGRPELILGHWIKPGAVVMDAGYNAGNIGDVQRSTAAERARLITPVPGGVGPMTIAMLLSQTVDAAERRR